MMISRRNLGGLAIGGLVVAQAARAAPSAGTGRRAEVLALRGFAETTHPRGREAAADADWGRRWDALAAGADGMADGAYFIALRRALGWFRDGHATLLPFEFTGGVPAPLAQGPFSASLPLRVRLFHDGIYGVAGHSSLLGTRVEKVGSMPAANLVRELARQWPGNDAWAQRWAAGHVVSPALLQGLGAITDPRAPVPFGTVVLRPAPGASEGLPELERTRREHERWADEAKGGNYVRPLPDRKAIYISLDEMGDTDARTFEVLTRDAFAAMEADGPGRLIVDLRRNGGGNNYFGEALRKRIGRSRFNRPGGLYVLTGPATFSAAQNLANRLERETFALFVGEPTGGAPNHYGDAGTFKGEATGITAIVSTIPWFDSYPQDKREWILPDLPVPELFEDWRSGRDPALEQALTHEAAVTDELDRDRIFYFRRPSQKGEWRPFWRT